MARWRLTLIVAAIAGITLIAFASQQLYQKRVPAERPQVAFPTMENRLPGNSLDETIYQENWETNGWDGWIPRDLNANPPAWHRDDYQAYGGSGMSWWMGDSTIGPNGGYTDHWYMVLDSPPVQLGATPHLSFVHRYHTEWPDLYQGYDGWDGINLRISTNNGSTWSVIPANVIDSTYRRAHLYSFGFIYNEGLNVPGWCGPHDNWSPETVDLAQWANQSVKIRWAFASDDYTSTPDSNQYFGWMVDAIRVYNGAGDTVLTNDGDSDGGFTSSTLVTSTGNLWHLVVDNTSPFGPHVVAFNDSVTHQYRANSNLALESPLIPLGNIGFGVLKADIAFRGAITCNQGADCDVWKFQISPDSGHSWCSIANAACNPDCTDWVFILSAPQQAWVGFDSSYDAGNTEIPYRNQALKFRIGFQSDGTNQAEGLYFDGFKLEFTAGYPNDVSCYSLQVRYPNVQGWPTRVKAYFRDEGQQPQNGVQAWYRILPNPQVAFLPTIDFPSSGSEATRQVNVTFPNAQTYDMLAYSALGSDGNLQNDTSYAPNIAVTPANGLLEVGYDNRPDTSLYYFNVATGSGACLHFTPHADTVVTGNYNVNQIKAQFFTQPGPYPIRMHVYIGAANQPGQQVLDSTITVLQNETGINVWKTINVSGVAGLQNISQDFWVWFQVTNVDPDPNVRYPVLLGDPAEPWSDIHHYTYGGTGIPTASTYFYKVHAVLAGGTAVDQPTTELPAEWSLAQNYPNPFNPVTEIRYSVPKAERMTLKVFNIVGQEVMTLVDGTVQAGSYTAKFDGSSLPSGVYVYRLESASFTESHKMLLLK